MTKVLITEDYLTNIGNSIRKENQTTTKYKPSEMANAIETNNANVATRVSAETEILNTQTSKLSNVLTALEGKASGSSGGGLQKESLTVNINADASMMLGGAFFRIYYMMYYNNNYDEIETLYEEISASTSFTLEGVVKGSMICMVASNLTGGMIGVEPSLDSTTVCGQYGSIVFVQINESETLNIEGQIFG